MKKYQTAIIELSEKLGNKYAYGQDLQTIIYNAASYGEQSNNGIMNFPAQIKKDEVDLSLNVKISGKDVAVSTPVVDPPQFAGRYAQLPDQILNYLKRHVEDFPFPQGVTTLEYSGKGPGTGIAKQ